MFVHYKPNLNFNLGRCFSFLIFKLSLQEHLKMWTPQLSYIHVRCVIAGQARIKSIFLDGKKQLLKNCIAIEYKTQKNIEKALFNGEQSEKSDINAWI